MDKWVNKTAVVTGASSGIGAVISLALADAGMIVIGLARRAEKIEELSSQIKGTGKIYAKKCDITNENEVNVTFDWINEILGGVHVLINNAGIMKSGFLIEEKIEMFKEVLDTNVLATCICVRKAIESIRQRSVKGHIILINSVLGHRIPDVPVPLFNIYPASKYAITALAQVVKQELLFHKTSIKLTSISPGMVNTDLLNTFTSPLFKALPKLESEDVKSAVIYALETPDHVQVDEIMLSAKQLFD